MPTHCQGAERSGAAPAATSPGWRGRLIYGLFVLSAYLTLLVLLATVPAVMLYSGRPFRHIAALLLIPPVLLDLCSAYMTVTYLTRGTQEHGQAGLSWFYYVPYALLGLSVAWWWRLATLAGLTLFHACCQYLLPLSVATRLGWRPHGGEFPYWPAPRARQHRPAECQPPED